MVDWTHTSLLDSSSLCLLALLPPLLVLLSLRMAHPPPPPILSPTSSRSGRSSLSCHDTVSGERWWCDRPSASLPARPLGGALGTSLSRGEGVWGCEKYASSARAHRSALSSLLAFLPSSLSAFLPLRTGISSGSGFRLLSLRLHTMHALAPLLRSSLAPPCHGPRC